MTTDVYTICWNESFLLPHFFAHYGKFARRIVVYDNGSDDGSQEIVRRLGGVLRTYNTRDQQDNEAMRHLKNNCWKESEADWVVVCDMDEFLQGHHRLAAFNPRECPAPVFLCEAWQIVTESPPTDFTTATRGVRLPHFDKCLCFPPTLKAINYNHGCHKAEPTGDHIVSGILRLYHYNFLSEDYVVQRWKRYVPRMSQSDRDNHWGEHYLHSIQSIREMWRQGWKDAHEIHPIPGS
jgi:glycosyltransferase involved in cell wall biosynthesis